MSTPAAPHRRRRLLACAPLILALASCTGSAPTPAPAEYPLYPCAATRDTPPPEYVVVPPGTIVFSQDAWKNMSEPGSICGAQAVRGARDRFEWSSMGGEDRIMFVATLARPGTPALPDPMPPTMTLYRVGGPDPIVVGTQVGGLAEQYRMIGNIGHDLEPGSYLMRIVSGAGGLLAEGRFELAP